MASGITGNTATSGAKQSNTWIQFTLFKQSINTSTNVTTSKTAAIGAILGPSSTSSKFNIWSDAYKLVQQREGELMEDYLNHLDALLMNVSPPTNRDLLSPEYIESIVHQLFIFRENGGIHVQFPTANTAAREVMKKLARFLLWSDSIVKTAVNTEPHAALAWSGVSLFFFVLATFPVYDKAMMEGFNTLSNMQIFWKACEETYLASSSSYHGLRDPLAELYSFVIEYQARIICHIAKRPVSRTLKWVTGSDNWAEMIQRLQSLEQSCLVHITTGKRAEIDQNRNIQLGAIQRQVTLQEEMLQDIKNNKQDEIERKLLEDLALASGDYARYKNVNPERVPGTCEWFLADDRFCEWRDSQTEALLWVSAGPGCGKSVLSKCLIDEDHITPGSLITIESSVIEVSQKPVVICYFFFKEGGEGGMDGAHALCAILHQLFQHSLTSNLITCALPRHKSHGKSLTQKMEVLWQILSDCAESSSADIVCVLDALDECRGDSAQQFIQMVEESYSQHDKLLRSLKLKLLITSRPYDDLKGSFDSLLSVATYMHFDGDEKSGQIGEEINLVIDAKVKNIARFFSDEDRNKISKRLKSMENRTYLWLHLTLDIIEKKRSAYSRSADIEKFLCELPSQVANAYEKILSRSQDERKVEALLQIVLAATRPLTLDEANIALALAVEEGGFPVYTTLEENLWPESIFKTTVQNLCGLFIRIHDSKLSFIHQTAREFLISQEQTGTWKGRLNLSKSHGTLSRACINYLQILDPSCEFPSSEYPFFNYASRNWFVHFRSQDAASTQILRKLARELCRSSPPQARFRLRDEGYGADLHLATRLGLAAVVHDVIVHEHADVNETHWRREDYANKRSLVTPLRLAIEEGHLQVMEVLLDHAHGARIEEDDIEIAARHRANAEAMMTLLLDRRGSKINITKYVLISVVENKQCGAAVLALLLKRRGDEIKITKSVVSGVARKGSVETMSLLLDERGNEFEITTDVIRDAVRFNERGMLALLLKRRRQEVKITKAVLIQAMTLEHPEILDLLLDHSNEIQITEEMVRVAAHNCYGPQIIQLLFSRRRHDIPVTRNIVKAAAGYFHHGMELMSELVDNYGHMFSITEDIFKAAVANGQNYVLKMVSLLLDRRGHEFIVTDDIFKAALGNRSFGMEIVTLLLNKRGSEINNFAEDIIKTAVMGQRKNGTWCGNIFKSISLEIISPLLDRGGGNVSITEDIFKAAILNEDYGLQMVTLLLDKRGHEISITEDIIKTAVMGQMRDETERKDTSERHRIMNSRLKIISLLLDRGGDNVSITEDIFKAAILNEDYGLQMVTLLLDKRGHEISITEDIIKTAVMVQIQESLGWRRSFVGYRNLHVRLQIISLLLNGGGDKVYVTDDIFKAAVANEKGGVEIVALLLKRRGHEIKITRGVVKVAQERRHGKDEMLALLQQKRGRATKGINGYIEGRRSGLHRVSK